MKNTNDEQEKMTLKGWLYFGLFLALCCLLVSVAYILVQILFGGWLLDLFGVN
ncbi:hypothetical protein SAMN05660328_102348 [Streptococcus gallolyticus]|uniref:Uncharacterized protein n=1 Tax=Streptococcus gallolyticus TaxID=315405 RepID=A0A1I7GV80_9STRE|nr:hypothetical protein [Streptococcus gallolyticus]SFC42574.1 hypothetical protein SAMN02983012_1300 [Streptococcus gallolyticus]SFU52325.1 hypothetical protein SAMN05660328_102348 [Streptococcus gallolyticus]